MPPPQFRVWWEVLESCSGRRGRFDDVGWFQAPEISIRGGSAFGAWFPAGNRIALLSGGFDGAIVRHEMLHAILRDGSHPKAYFEGRCGDVVACGRDCAGEVIPPNPIRLTTADFDVDIEIHPKSPSLTRDNGRLTFILNVRNRTGNNAYLNDRALNHLHCPVGVMLVSVNDPDRSALTCGYVGYGGLPRLFQGFETRRMVLDVHLQHLGQGDGPFFAEPLEAWAILGNNVRRSANFTMRP